MKARTIIVILALAWFAVLPGQRDGPEMGQAALAGLTPGEFGAGLPVGSIVVYAGSTAPDGWLMCDGALYDVSELPDLFKVVGFTYGRDTTETAFRVPDLTGRVPVGVKPFTWYCDTLGKTGGAAEVSLSVSEMPAHKHNVSASSHTHSLSVSPHTHTITASSHTHTTSPHGHGITDPKHSHGVTDPGHSHGITDPGHHHRIDLDSAWGIHGIDDAGESMEGGTDTGEATTGITIQNATTGIGINVSTTAIKVQSTTVSVDSTTATASAKDATVGVSAQGASVNLSEESQGSGSPHENLPPYIVLQYIIKY